MKLRLVHTLSLALVGLAGAAVLVLGGLTAWNLRHGFGRYLAEREVQHLERLVATIESAAARDGGLESLRQGRMDLRGLFLQLDGQAPGAVAPVHPSTAPGPPLPAGHEPFPERVQVLGPDGSLLMGRPSNPPAAESAAFVTRPVVVRGETVAQVRLRQSPALRDRSEERFLQDQYRAIALTAAAGVLGALALAIGLARRWSRPLEAVQAATRRLARGEFTVRLDGRRQGAGPDEIGDVVRNVNLMARELERMEGARRRWLADVSHELRTPLTVLRGHVEALRDGVRPLDPAAVATLHEELLRLARLVDDLHLLAVSDLRALPCHPARVDAIELVGRVVRRFEPRAVAAGLGLSWSPPEPPQVMPVQWDPDRIEQLLANLVDNSLRHTDRPGEVRVGLRAADGEVIVTVDDSAPGVPPEQLAQIFEPLHRGDPARSRHDGGSGLGLAICRAIAQAHGGRMHADASDLGGLRVTLVMPQQAHASPRADGERA